MEKSIILSGINKNNNGVLTVDDSKNIVKINLNVSKDSYILLLKTDKIRAFKVEDVIEILEVNNIKITEITAVLIKDYSMVLYGSSKDKMQAFRLFSEYKNLVKNGKIYVENPKKYIENYDVFNKKTDKKQEKNDEKGCDNSNKNTVNNSDNLQKNSGKNNVKNSDIIDKNIIKNPQNNCENIIKNVVINSKKTTKNKQENEENNNNNTENNEEFVYKGDNFFMSIKNQIDELFICYPEEKSISKLIKNSKFAKIDYSKTEYYVVGVIKAFDKVEYLCYGIPGVKDILPPAEVSSYAKFLPLSNESNSGYWMIFQDGVTGKTALKEQIDFI